MKMTCCNLIGYKAPCKAGGWIVATKFYPSFLSLRHHQWQILALCTMGAESGGTWGGGAVQNFLWAFPLKIWLFYVLFRTFILKILFGHFLEVKWPKSKKKCKFKGRLSWTLVSVPHSKFCGDALALHPCTHNVSDVPTPVGAKLAPRGPKTPQKWEAMPIWPAIFSERDQIFKWKQNKLFFHQT